MFRTPTQESFAHIGSMEMPSTHRIKLPEVTLIAIEGRSTKFFTEMAHKALCFSKREIDFGATCLLSQGTPQSLDSQINHVKIKSLENSAEYSRFIVQELHAFVTTPFCLIVQADGFVLNPERWLPEFLNYDYIGAPWQKTTAQRLGGDYVIHDISAANRVGNGGFSLRSHKLLTLCKEINYDIFGSLPEDFIICRIIREHLESSGIRFAPLELAARFSLEQPIEEAPYHYQYSFGFHGHTFDPYRLLLSLDQPASLPENQVNSPISRTPEIHQSASRGQVSF